MSIIDAIIGSNLVQMIATYLFGAMLYFLFRHYRSIFVAAGYFVAIGIIISFLCGIGEVYSYSQYYRRAFFVYGDDITTVIVLFFLFSVVSKNELLGVATSAAMFMSGGKISFILLLLMLLILVSIPGEKKNRKPLLHGFASYAALGLTVYVSTLAVSALWTKLDVSKRFGSSYFEVISDAVDIRNTPYAGTGACKELSLLGCMKKQASRAIVQRYYSSLAGLWMTLEGGYWDRYPATFSEFADLMMRENPWGMNDRYGLEWSDWKKMGVSQNPYLRFGSGYGPWLLGALVLIFALIGTIGISNLIKGEGGIAALFTIYFVVNVLFNQTQSWTTSGSNVLMLLGFCSIHIILVWLHKRYVLPDVLRPYADDGLAKVAIGR